MGRETVPPSASTKVPPDPIVLHTLLDRVSFALLVLGAAPAHADVLRVDPFDPTAYRMVQPAVNAASDGDVILVADGLALAAFTIDAKALTVVVDGALNDFGAGQITVRNLAVNQPVTLRGLKGGGLRLENNAGEVWLDTVRFSGGAGFPFGPSFPLDVENCASVVIVNSLFFPPNFSTVYASLQATNSAITAFDSNFLGSPGDNWGGADGADGVVLLSSQFHAEGCQIRGSEGNGGYWCGLSCGCQPFCSSDGDGGAGISLDTPSSLRSRANTILGGDGGLPCGGGTDGAPIDNAGGTVVDLFGIERHANAEPTAREGQRLTVYVQGRGGDITFLLVSENPLQTSLSTPYVGELFLGAGFQLLPIGALDPLGTAAYDYTAPSLPAGERARLLTFQPVFFDALAGFPSLGGPSRAIVLETGL